MVLHSQEEASASALVNFHLKGVNLTINSGETHAVMGPNGSGKSTLSYVIAGHPKYEVTEGEILLDSAGAPVAVLRTTDVDVAAWRAAHADFWGEHPMIFGTSNITSRPAP